MCSTTPRFSYGVSETSVPRCVPVPSRVVHAVYGRVYRYWVVRAGWVYRVGNTGSQALPSYRAKGGPRYSEAGPVALQGRSGWYLGPEYPCAPGDHPSGPVGSLQAPPCHLPENAASWPIRRDSTSFSIKLVKTAECHQNMSKRPTLVPISQNGSRKSPLDILGFPISLAFSHKELMGMF